MSSTVDKIKERLQIEEVISYYIKLDKSGSNLKSKCPFHNEKTPSFTVSPDRGTYYCFGCGAKGDIFTFVQEFEGLDFKGALKFLAEKAGVTIENEDPKNRSEKQKFYEIMEIATIFFQNNLMSDENSLNYIRKRGVSSEIIKKFRLGYVKNEWKSLFNFLKKRGFTETQMEKVGLIKKTTSGELKYYDVFRGRIMFPIFDNAGRVIAFSGRIIISDEKSPKYLNSPDTELFNKSEVLYGLNFAKGSIREKGYSIIVEGQMDLLLAHQNGFENTVASSGTALTEKHLDRLSGFAKKTFISYDSDSPGFKAALRGAIIALSLGMDVALTDLPKGSDPADILFEDYRNWKKFVENSKHIIDFYIDNLLSLNLPEIEMLREIKNNILPLVSSLPSNIERNYFVSRIANKLNLKEDSIWQDLNKLNSEFINNGHDTEKFEIKNNELISRKNIIERKIMGILFWQKEKRNSEIDKNSLKEKIKNIVGEDYFNDLFSKFTPIKDEVIFEAENYYQNRDNLKNDINELILNFEEDYLRRKRDNLTSKLKKVEKDSKEEKELMKNYNDLTIKLEFLKNKNF